MLSQEEDINVDIRLLQKHSDDTMITYNFKQSSGIVQISTIKLISWLLNKRQK